MKTAIGPKAAGLAGVLMLAAVTCSAAPASASTSTPDDGRVDIAKIRIFDRTYERMPARATASQTLAGISTQSYVPMLLPPGVALAAGESLQVNYSDGVVTQQAIALGCTATSSVSNPYVQSGGARAQHSYGLSSGCGATAYVNGILGSFAWPLWHNRDFRSVTVRPGFTTYWTTSRVCVNSGSTTWRSENFIGSAVTAVSSAVNLACNPG